MYKITTLILFLFCLQGFSQPAGYPVEDSLELNGITSSDTLLYFKWFQVTEPFTIEFDYSDLDTDDATLDVGFSNYNNTYNSSDDEDLPFTLNVTSSGYTNNDGDTKASIVVQKEYQGFKYLIVKLEKGTVGAGKYITWKYIR